MHTIDTRYVGKKSDLKYYKSNAKVTARELCYPHWVIEQIDAAQSEIQVDNALANGRKAM